MKKVIPQEYHSHLKERNVGQEGGERQSVITTRGVMVGCIMCVIIAIGVPYGGMVIRGTRLGLSSATPAAFFLLFILLLTVHLLLGAIKRKWAFQWGELLTIFFMMMVATAIPTRGVVGLLLPMISGTYYYASPENQWATLVHPLLNKWQVVSNIEAVKNFYEGSAGAVQIPWASWLPTLGCWLVFYAVFYLTLISIMVILRRQWVEHERLPYPLAQVPLAMIAEDGRGGLLKPFFKNGVMWIGFAIPFLVNSINALHHYAPEIPLISLNTQVPLFLGTSLRINVNFLMLGFAYLISSTISFSLWIFFLLRLFQEHLMFVLGVQSAQNELGEWSVAGIGHQMVGALLVLVLYGLWSGRGHLVEVWRKALGRQAAIDDSGEIISYRSAVLGCAAGSSGMVIWLWLSGIPAWIAPLLVFSALVIFVGLTRVITEAGLPTVTPAMVPADFVISSVGVSALGPVGLAATAYTLIWAGDLLVFMSAPLANGLRLGSEMVGRRRLLFWAVILAMVISLLTALWFTLYLGYRYGAVNLHSQYFKTFAAIPSEFIAKQLNTPSEPSLEGWIWFGSGAAIMSALTLARLKFAWWPLHPLGFAVSAGWIMNSIWISIFLAWLCKVMILKFGGASVYQKSKPFFLGMALSQVVTGGLWLVVDGFTGTVGNTIPVY